MRPQIFVSYSHQDDRLVAPVVALLRASRALIFRDAEQLQPGRKWRAQLDAAIEGSSMVVVFWCRHARSSEEVRKEYTAAIDQGKEVLPLLIDDTPLPPELAAYQYIDFRDAFPDAHAVASPAPARASPTPWVGLVAVLALLVAGGAWLSLQTAASSPADVPGPIGGTPGGAAPWLLPALLVVAGFLGFLAFLAAFRRRQRVGPPAPTRQHAELAEAISTELLRRTGPSAADAVGTQA